MRKWVLNSLIVGAIVLLFGLAMYFGNKQTKAGEEGFVGTDSTATEQIEEANPGYEQWFSPIFEPASGEVESGLFALQAALGAGVLGFALGALWQRNRPRTPADAEGSVRSADDTRSASAEDEHAQRRPADASDPVT